MRSICHLTSLGLSEAQDCLMTQQGAGTGATDALSDTLQGALAVEHFSSYRICDGVLLHYKATAHCRDAQARAKIQWPALGLF